MSLGFALKTLRTTSTSKFIPLSRFITSTNHINHNSSKPTTFSSFSSASENHQNPIDEKFTVSQLIESFGLTLQAAKRLSTKLNLESSADRPTQVLRFFKEYGFSDSQITRIVRLKPEVLLSDPERFLKPKVEIFGSFGASSETAVKIVEKCPNILRSSVNNRLLPSLEALRKLVGADREVVRMMLRWHNLFLHHLGDTLAPNVETLREVGVSESMIKKTLDHRTHGLLCPADRFRNAVDKVKGLGFDVNKFNFVDAAIMISSMRDHVWEQRCSAFRKWGWSDADLVNAFLKYPLYMGSNEKKVHEIMDFLVNYMGFNPSSIAESPWIFRYRKERIVSRCSILKTLLTKGVLTKYDSKLISVVIWLEPVFIEKFVKKHETVHPELLGLYYQSKKDGIPF